MLEGADRANRRPVGRLPLPARVRELLDAFARTRERRAPRRSSRRFRRRYVPGSDLRRRVHRDAPRPRGRGAARARPVPGAPCVPRRRSSSRMAAQKRDGDPRRARRGSVARSSGRGFPSPSRSAPRSFPSSRSPRRAAPCRGSGRGRSPGGERARRGPRRDVLTRPVLKSWLLPTAASVLGPAEIAYHAQALSLFPIFGLVPPVLLPRSFVVPVGPAERRAVEALEIPDDALLLPAAASAPVDVPAAPDLARAAEGADRSLAALEPRRSRRSIRRSSARSKTPARKWRISSSSSQKR